MSRGGETRRPWTPRDDQELRRLAAIDGQNHVTAGAALGRTSAAVQNRASSLGIRFQSDCRREDPLDGIFLNGEPLRFAVVDRPCARCAVRETIHHQFGCGQFATAVSVRVI